MRDVAGAFVDLQDDRHRADYDPPTRFLPSEVASILRSAPLAREGFEKVAQGERADVLALLLVGARA
jgi:hypothetical protein